MGAFFNAPHKAYAAEGAEPDQYVYVRLIADKKNVSAGDEVRIGLEQLIHPKWHTYWKNPGDSGLATSINWNLPEGFEVTELEWPTPEKIPFGPLTNYGYEGRVILLQTLKIADDIADTPIQLDATVNLLVCYDICIPETHDVSIILNGTTPAEAANIQEAENEISSTAISSEFYESNGDLSIVINDTNFKTDGLDTVTLLPEAWGGIDNTVEASISEKDGASILTQKRGDRDLNEISDYTVYVKAQYNDGSSVVYKTESALTDAPREAANTSTPTSNVSFIQAILFALFGGIILNLMPCVFPVLSMKALSLIKLNDDEQKVARKHGIAYTVGILATFTFIGGLLLLLKAGGAQIGWGFQLQNPIIILGLAYLVFILGLNMAGYFDFSNRLSGFGQKQASASGTKGAFFTGVLATLVATPCTAPFMGAALGYALTQSALTAMAVFWALGLGLAIPYLLITFIPAIRHKLPRPGAWMDSFKQFLSFPLFITAAWLVWVLSQQGNSKAVLLSLVGMIAIALVLWLGKHLNGSKKKIFVLPLMILSLFFVAATFFQVPSNLEKTGNLAPTTVLHDTAEVFTPENLQTALDGDRPVFVNMTAAWCITCKVNERIALKSNKVAKLFEEQNVIYMKGDWTNKDADITAYLNEFSRQGVPLYVYYGARDADTGTRPDPVLLPQILTANTVEKYLTKNQN